VDREKRSKLHVFSIGESVNSTRCQKGKKTTQKAAKKKKRIGVNDPVHKHIWGKNLPAPGIHGTSQKKWKPDKLKRIRASKPPVKANGGGCLVRLVAGTANAQPTGGGPAKCSAKRAAKAAGIKESGGGVYRLTTKG